MKRFGIGAAVGFVTVFGSFYLMALRGEAGENMFDSLTRTSDHVVEASSGPSFSALGEPSIQESAKDLNSDKHEEVKREPSSGHEEMQVSLRKAGEPKKEILIEQKFPISGGNSQKIESKPESSASLKYIVQVASNTDKAASDVMLEKLEAQGFKGYVQSATVNEKQYYRVRLGPVSTKEEAHNLRDKALKAKGVSNALVARE